MVSTQVFFNLASRAESVELTNRQVHVYSCTFGKVVFYVHIVNIMLVLCLLHQNMIA